MPTTSHFGVFDINGDGKDDIKNVVRDFERWASPSTPTSTSRKKWVAALTTKTRYAIKGNVPNPRGNDPFVKEKSELNQLLWSEAAIQAKNKGITEVSYRDLFPRMGYRV